jgi:phosphopantothenoylcysteine decarboxylase/phosphopantothenate--cysteine ligase
MMHGSPEARSALAGRSVAIGIGGGIAVYKMASVVSTLAQAGCAVHVLMTEAATRFVTPLTFEALAGRPVHTSIWEQVDQSDPQHIKLATSIDVCLVAPCTMDLLAKLVAGRADDPVSLLVAAIDRRRTPVLLAPSMNAVMWEQPATRRNKAQAEADGFHVLAPGSGWQACRTVGAGRLPEPDDLVDALGEVLARR